MADLQSAPSPSSGKEPADFSLSSPSTRSSQTAKYDVFINNRGPDVKKTLASILYETLKSEGLRVFLDTEELELGDDIPDTLKHVIRSSSVHIAILSENYAQSAWCLAELDLMLRTDAKIVPVFYNVSESVPRHCQEPYAGAFREHERKARYSKDQIEKWKDALHKVSFKSGCHLDKHNGELGKLWKEIVDTALKEVKKSSRFEDPKHPVGLEEAVEDFNGRWEREEKPKLVEIVGMGGSGKTTLARKLFDLKQSAFDARCFLSDVRKKCAMNKLQTLQQQLSRDLVNLHDYKIDCLIEGKNFLRSRFEDRRTSRYLIILDDIDHKDQIDALLVESLLHTDSLIIITSRDRGLLRAKHETMLYEMKPMGDKHARELFCLHAFGQPLPENGFENLVDLFLKVCVGLPLSLEVLGGHLSGKAKEEWKNELDREVLHADIESHLERSYDALNRGEKEMFLDVACFFTDHPKNMAIKIWDASEWDCGRGLQTLEDKCLIEVHQGKSLRTHPLLRNLGKGIAAVDKNVSRRIWKKPDREKLERDGFHKVLTSPITFRTFLKSFPCSPKRPQNLYPNRSFLNKNKNPSGRSVKLSTADLFLGNDRLQPEVSRTSTDLLWLKWENCPEKSIPSWLRMTSLRHLEVVNGELNKLWNSEAPSRLRELVIKWNPLRALPEGFESLTNLEHINFHGCRWLGTLPKCFSSLTKLQYLDLCDCARLKIEPGNLPFGNESLTGLKTLRLLGTNVSSEVLNEIVKLKSLECLAIGHDSLTDLSSLESLTGLTTLCIGGCKNMKSLSFSLRNLSSLKQLTIRTSGVEYLPEGIGELSSLETLEVEECPITELTLIGVKDEVCRYSLENITLHKTEVKKVSISEVFCRNLKILDLEENLDLIEVDVKLPRTLERLRLSGCSRLKRIPGMPNLEELKELTIRRCCSLESQLPSLKRLCALERFTADKCWKLQNTGSVEWVAGLEILPHLASDRVVHDRFGGLQILPSHQIILAGMGVKPIQSEESSNPTADSLNPTASLSRAGMGVEPIQSEESSNPTADSLNPTASLNRAVQV